MERLIKKEKEVEGGHQLTLLKKGEREVTGRGGVPIEKKKPEVKKKGGEKVGSTFVMSRRKNSSVKPSRKKRK